MKVLILGVTGMLGNTMFRYLSQYPDVLVYGTARNENAFAFFSENLRPRIVTGINVESQDSLIEAFSAIRPDVVVNCIGLIKQLADCNDPLITIPINALLPHRLAALCKTTGARLIHVSTDCVFSGDRGHYVETDFPDAHDLYGRSKLLGEVEYPHTITLRTSLIGHELSTNHSLVSWFLSQENTVRGYTNAIFSGLPTVELSRVVHEFILPRPDLSGLYHVASPAINKFELLELIASVYNKKISIVPDGSVRIDRSLNADKFRTAAGYVSPEWPELVLRMSKFH